MAKCEFNPGIVCRNRRMSEALFNAYKRTAVGEDKTLITSKQAALYVTPMSGGTQLRCLGRRDCPEFKSPEKDKLVNGVKA